MDFEVRDEGIIPTKPPAFEFMWDPYFDQGSVRAQMSAFGCKADVNPSPAECPLIAKSRHSTYQVGDKVWGIAVGLLEFEGRVEQGGAGFRHIRMNKP